MDVFLVLTGRSKNGKDAVKEILLRSAAKDSIALVDWFKVGLSKIIGIPVGDFYSSKKDQPFVRPLIIGERHLRQMVRLIADNSEEEDWSYTKIPSGNYMHREFASVRDLMRWFGQDFVAKNCGADFHCKVTDRALAEKRAKNKSDGINLYIISDARFPHEVKYWQDRYNSNGSFVYAVKVENPSVPKINTITEDGVDKIPDSMLFTTIKNDGDLDHLTKACEEVVKSISADISTKVASGEVKFSTGPSVGTANKDTPIARRLRELGIDPSDPPEVKIAKMKAVEAAVVAKGQGSLGIGESVTQDDTPTQKNGEEDDTITEEESKSKSLNPYFKEGDPTYELTKEAELNDVSKNTQTDNSKDSVEKSQEKPKKKRGRPKGAKDKAQRTRAKATKKDIE